LELTTHLFLDAYCFSATSFPTGDERIVSCEGFCKKKEERIRRENKQMKSQGQDNGRGPLRVKAQLLI